MCQLVQAIARVVQVPNLDEHFTTLTTKRIVLEFVVC